MPKYSRMQRYQVLRDRLEEETTEAQQVQNEQPYQRLSRVANKDSNGNLSHANNPHKEASNQTVSSTLPNSPVMDHLIDEVRQYNLDQGNSVWDDTQINILKQLDGTQSKHRNQHFVPLEQQQEDLGSTMQVPVTKIKEVQDKTILQEKEKEEPVVEDKGPTILPMSEKPLPMYPLEEEEPEEQTIFEVVEQMPEFPNGGMAGLMQYLSKNIKYPTIAQENGTQGRVTVQFVVNKDGSIVDAKVLRGVDPYLDKEAVRVIMGMPKWKPGMQRGKPVRVKYTVPVMFRLQ